MKSIFLSLLGAVALIAITPLNAIAAFSWDVSPGPNGTFRVNTSDGTYIVDIEGNHGWVGTEQEYERLRISGVLKANGYREMNIVGQDANTHQVVSAKMPSTSVGATNLANIYSEIYFGATPSKEMHRPQKSVDSEFVGATWVQSDKKEIQAKILDQESDMIYSPTYCHSIPTMNMRTCEFIVPTVSLVHKSSLLFAMPRTAPAVVPMLSLAKEQENVLLEKYKPAMGSRFGLEDEDAKILLRLHDLDNSIATSLPPLPAGVTEIPPTKKGCRDTEIALTKAQFDAIAIGASAADVQCAIGYSSHSLWIIDDRHWERIWKMKGGGYALISVTDKKPETVIDKRIQSSVDIRW